MTIQVATSMLRIRHIALHFRNLQLCQQHRQSEMTTVSLLGCLKILHPWSHKPRCEDELEGFQGDLPEARDLRVSQ